MLTATMLTGSPEMSKHRRQHTAPFLALPKHLIRSAAFEALSSSAIKLLLQLGEQYNGSNNGNLQASWTSLKEKGWSSKGTINRATLELQDKGFVKKTRQGYLRPHRCSLFALTWKSIDHCNGIHDEPPTRVAENSWKNFKP